MYKKSFLGESKTRYLSGHSRIYLFCFQGFTLEFHFEPNEHFANTMLTKQYTMRSEPDESDPFSFEGPEIVKCKGYVFL